MSEVEDTEVEEEEQSEFGRGVVVCLAKFAEHMGMDEQYRACWQLIWHRKGGARELGRHAKFQLDFSQRWRAEHPEYEARFPDAEASAIHRQIEQWANAASDHFYDLDRERAPECLCELADLTLRMGHGFDETAIWGEDHLERVDALWKQSCLALDEALGVEAEWGRW